jgi:hypothetical protein
MFLICEMLSCLINSFNFCKIIFSFDYDSNLELFIRVYDFDLELVYDLIHILFYIYKFIELYMFISYIEFKPIQTWSFFILFDKFIILLSLNNLFSLVNFVM